MDGEPYDRLDLGYGDYRFKRELSNAQQTLIHGFVGAPSAASLVREAAYGVRRVAEALPLGRASSSRARRCAGSICCADCGERAAARLRGFSDSAPAMTLTLDDIKAAAHRLEGHIERTPCRHSMTLSQITGAEVWVKFENLQFTASYKERGALNKLLQLSKTRSGAG